MSILVVGSLAFDDILTPTQKVENALGGTVTYFSIAASLFSKVNVVATIGTDFDESHKKVFSGRNIDLSGLITKPGKTFKWVGKYETNVEEAITLDTQLNVYADFSPIIPDNYKNSEYVFLAGIGPDLQKKVLEQIKKPKFIVLDTKVFFIEKNLSDLKEVMKSVDALLINEDEAKLLTSKPNLYLASKELQKMGPKYVIIKKGSNGVMMADENSFFSIPAFPVENVVDPTGAGDTFAAGFMGYLAENGTINSTNIRKALAVGTILASFNIEDFSVNRLKDVTKDDIKRRFSEFKRFISFEAI